MTFYIESIVLNFNQLYSYSVSYQDTLQLAHNGAANPGAIVLYTTTLRGLLQTQRSWNDFLCHMAG